MTHVFWKTDESTVLSGQPGTLGVSTQVMEWTSAMLISTKTNLYHHSIKTCRSTHDFVDCLTVMLGASCKHSNLPPSFSSYRGCKPNRDIGTFFLGYCPSQIGIFIVKLILGYWDIALMSISGRRCH